MKIKVIIKEPKKQFKILTIDNSLESFQKEVGGLIECIYVRELEGIDIIGNEEGRPMGLENNLFSPTHSYYLKGTLIFAAADDEGETIGLTDEQIKRATEFINNNSYEAING